MGTVVLNGAGSGSTTLTPTDAVTVTVTLPSATATLATLGANTFTGNQAITGTLSASGAATLSSTLAVTGAVVCSAGSGYTFKGAGASTSAMFSGSTANATDFEWGPDIGVSSIWRVQNSGGTGVYLTSGNTAWTANSDERLKNIAGEFTGALDFIVSKVRTVRGTWKADETKRSRSFLIAQDWEDYLPEGIEVSADGILGLTKEDTIPVAFAAIKELAAMVKNLTARLAALEAK